MVSRYPPTPIAILIKATLLTENFDTDDYDNVQGKNHI
jgi:hypothetical protein